MKITLIHCPTKQDWIDVCEKIEKDYPEVRWYYGGEKPTECEEWHGYKEASCLRIENENLGYNRITHFQQYSPNTKIISAQEFLGKPTEKIIMPEMEKMKELVDTFIDDWNNLKRNYE